MFLKRSLLLYCCTTTTYIDNSLPLAFKLLNYLFLTNILIRLIKFFKKAGKTCMAILLPY